MVIMKSFLLVLFSLSLLNANSKDLDHCLSNPCLNQGACVVGNRSYTCLCSARWSGVNCEADVDECLSQPCENSGNCINGVNGFVCKQGYEGNRCQNEIERQTTLIAILISSICVLVIAVLVTVCCCLRYRRERKKIKSKAIGDFGKCKQRTEIKNEDLQKVKTERSRDEVYDKIEEGDLSNNTDYVTPTANVEPHSDANGYLTIENTDQKVR